MPIQRNHDLPFWKISKLTDRLEKDSSEKSQDKAEKKEKFTKLPTSSQSTILLASSSSTTVARTVANPELDLLLQQSSLSRARTYLNQTLTSFNCRIDASSLLTATVMAGDLVWSRCSHTPEKFIICLMGKPAGASKISQKDLVEDASSRNQSQCRVRKQHY